MRTLPQLLLAVGAAGVAASVHAGTAVLSFDTSAGRGVMVDDAGARNGTCLALDQGKEHGAFAFRTPPLQAGWNRFALRLRLNRPRNPWIFGGFFLVDIPGARLDTTLQPGYKRAYVPLPRFRDDGWQTFAFDLYLPSPGRHSLSFLHERGEQPPDLEGAAAMQEAFLGAGDAGADPLDDLLGGGLDLGLEEEDLLETRPLLLLDTATFTPLDRGVSVRSVLVDKVFYQPGEQVRADVALVNHGTGNRTVDVSGMLHWDLDGEAAVFERSAVPIGPGATNLVEASWTLGPEELWGGELEVRVEQAGSLLASRRALVPVARNVSRMLHYTFVSEGRGPGPEPRENDLLNLLEFFALWPDDWGEHTPEADAWFAGQGGGRVTQAGIRQVIEDAHARGRRVLFYNRFIAYGPPGFETARTHPGWFFDLDGSYDAHGLHLWDEIGRRFNKANLSTSFFTYGLRPNLAVPGVQQHLLDEWIGTTEQFGWDGFRNDGYWWIDRPGGGLDDDATAAMIRSMKAAVRRRFPDFIFGVNTFNDFDLDEALRSGRVVEVQRGYGPMTETLGAICEDDGFILNEKGLARMDWDTFVRKHVFITDFILGHGGQFLLHDNGNRDRQRFGNYTSSEYHYVGVLNRAMGGHMGPAAPLHGAYAAYATRYAGLLYDPALQRVPGPEALLSVDAENPVWWTRFVKRKDKQKGERLIVQLINPPLPRVHDDAWHDASRHRYRPVVPGATVTVSPREGLRLERAWWGTAEPDVRGGFLEPETVAGATTVRVPPIATWTTLVLDFGRTP